MLLCFCQGSLTVFSGQPGTGKTSICAILARALGLDFSGGALLFLEQGQNPGHLPVKQAAARALQLLEGDNFLLGRVLPACPGIGAAGRPSRSWT